MAYCGKCLHEEVCATARPCDGRVPKSKHFLQKGTLIPVTCKLGEKGCYGDGKCRYKKDCENKVITHADQIRGMSDEELAKFIERTMFMVYESVAKVCRIVGYAGQWDSEGIIREEIEWLKQEAET